MDEEWKAIKGYSGKYLVSSLGRVRSDYAEYNQVMTKKRTTILKATINKNGYYAIRLSLTDITSGRRISKTKKVHRLVCEAFHQNPNNKSQVNHKDLNRLNNKADNLEWCTAKENTTHAQANGRIPVAKPYIKKGYRKGWKKIIDTQSGVIYDTAADLAVKIGTKPRYIRRKLTGERNNNTPYRYL